MSGEYFKALRDTLEVVNFAVTFSDHLKPVSTTFEFH
jgi:hypothetical protein